MDLLIVGIAVAGWVGVMAVVLAFCAVAGRADSDHVRLIGAREPAAPQLFLATSRNVPFVEHAVRPARRERHVPVVR